MATMKEAIYALLYADAQVNAGVQLGALLGHSAAAPYGIYFMAPPKNPDLPLITYFINAQSGRFPRIISVSITAWGNNFEAIQNRIYDLLHKVSLITADYSTKLLIWDNASAEIWDDNLKIYFRQDRFLAKGIVI